LYVTELIGAGGIGEVYRATDIKLGRNVALKILPSDVASDLERSALQHRSGGEGDSLSIPFAVLPDIHLFRTGS